jgi:hypothetical protein
MGGHEMTTFMWLILVLFLITLGMLLGIFYALNHFRDERQHARSQQAQYQAQWDAIQPNERVEWSYWLARQRMLDEARRQRQW